MKHFLAVFSAFILLVVGAPSLAQKAEEEKVPLVIEAQKLTYSDEEKVAIYIGNVIAQHGQTILKGDKLIIYFDKSGKNIKKIIVEGNVKIKDPRGEGSCDKLIYYPYQEKVVLIGNAVLKQDKNLVVGDKIVALKSGKIEVIGEKQRVKTVIYPEEANGKLPRP